eukprot:3205037-Ditylum_brightwellii.AAC.1
MVNDLLDDKRPTIFNSQTHKEIEFPGYAAPQRTQSYLITTISYAQALSGMVITTGRCGKLNSQQSLLMKI